MPPTNIHINDANLSIDKCACDPQEVYKTRKAHDAFFKSHYLTVSFARESMVVWVGGVTIP